MDELLTLAEPGDGIDPAALEDACDRLRGLANSLDAAALAPGLALADLQALGRSATALRDQATRLVVARIDLLAGEARITARQIEAAVKAADAEIRRAADIPTRLRRAVALVALLAAVGTGSGSAMLKAADGLRRELG